MAATLLPGQYINPQTGQPAYPSQNSTGGIDPQSGLSPAEEQAMVNNAQQSQAANTIEGYKSTMPQTPDYIGMTNPDGSLKSPYSVNTNNAGLNGLEQRVGQVGGTSPWAQMTLQKQAQDQNTAMGQAANTASGNTAGAMSALETSGGMTGGARERVATAGARSADASEQAVSNQGADARLSIGIQDEQNRQAAQGQLAGYDQQDKTLNASNTVGANQAQNAYNMENYGNQIKAWSGAVNADATSHSGKK